MLMIIVCSISVHAEENVEFETLEKGSKGEAVIKLQERLNELGYSVGKVDGQFGKKTESAVKSFQQMNGLEVNGIVDSITYESIFSSEAVKPTPAPTPKPTNTPKPKQQSSSSSSLLSEKECLKRAKDYIKKNYPGYKILLEPSSGTTSKLVSVAFTLSNGWNTGMVVLSVDRTTGSIKVEH